MAHHLLSAHAALRNELFDAFLRCFERMVSTDQIACALRKLAKHMSVSRGCAAPADPERDALVYIGSGATKLIASASSGREQIVAFHFAGDLVSIPCGSWHSYKLCALVDTEMLVFPADEFLDIARADPIVLNTLLERSLTALHRCRDKAVGLGRKTAQERLASFLVGMAERIGSKEADRCRLDLPMSRRDIGDSLGLTIETVSRQFGELRLAGLIETTGRSRVLLCEPTVLAARAGHV